MKRIVIVAALIITCFNMSAQKLEDAVKDIPTSELLDYKKSLEAQKRSYSSRRITGSNAAERKASGLVNHVGVAAAEAQLEIVNKELAARRSVERTNTINTIATQAAVSMAHTNQTIGTDIMIKEAEEEMERSMVEMDKRIEGMSNLRGNASRSLSVRNRRNMLNTLEDEKLEIKRYDSDVPLFSKEAADYALKKFQKSNRYLWKRFKQKPLDELKEIGKSAIAQKTIAPVQVIEALDNADAIVEAEMEITKDVLAGLMKAIETEDPRYLDITFQRTKNSLLKMYMKVSCDLSVFGIDCTDMWDALYSIFGPDIEEL